MNARPTAAQACAKKRGNQSLTRADRVTHRAWTAALATVTTLCPGVTLDGALRAGLLNAADLSAVHAWAERTTGAA